MWNFLMEMLEFECCNIFLRDCSYRNKNFCLNIIIISKFQIKMENKILVTKYFIKFLSILLRLVKNLLFNVKPYRRSQF